MAYTFLIVDHLYHKKCMPHQNSKHASQSHPKHPAPTQHLLTKIVKKQLEQPEVDQPAECKYGIFCAHLRSRGKCSMPHRKSHYHFLNLVAPLDALEDPEIDPKALSKREKKEKKIIQKTISSQIDVAALDHQEQLLKNKGDAEAKKELIEMLEEGQRKAIELVDSSTASEFYEKLNGIDKRNVFELRRKAMIQLKKKKQALFNEIIDKEYRIANRLIKASLKSRGQELYQLYKDINHDTLPSVRQYFEAYFQQSSGIPHQKQQKSLLDSTETVYLQAILNKIFFLQPQEYVHPYLFLRSDKVSAVSLMANAVFYNMLVPFKLLKEMEYNFYLFVDCQECLTFNRLSDFLMGEYMSVFYGKLKAPPDYLFGQLEANRQKFINWATKISLKFKENNSNFKIVLILDKVESLFQKAKLQEFQQQKQKQRQAALLSVIQLFPTTIIFVVKDGGQQTRQSLCGLLSIDEESLGQHWLSA